MILFEVPNEILEVHSHLSWIPRLIPHLETSRTKNISNFKEYLLKHYFPKKENDKNEGDQGKKEEIKAEDDAVKEDLEADEVLKFDPNFTSSFHALATCFARLSFLIYLEKFKEAKGLLMYCDEVIKTTPEDQLEKEEGYRHAIRYCFRATMWQINTLEKLKTGTFTNENEGFRENYIIEEKRDLNIIWNKLYVKNKRFTATMKFFKGYLASHLRTKIELKIPHQLYIKAATVDPDCYVWCHVAYSSLRGFRKLPVFGNCSDEPSEEERYYCQKAYELCPGEPMIILDYALLIREGFWEKGDEFFRNSQDEIKKCIELFEQSLERATELKKTELVDDIKLYLALILMRTETSSNFERGKALLEGLPDDSEAVFLLGRLHMYGRQIDGIKRYQDLNKAVKIFSGILNKEPDYHSCVKDLLKVLSWKRDPGYEKRIFEVSDKFIQESELQMLRADVLSFRGNVLWPHKQTLACQSWIDALIKYPTFKGKVYESIKNVIMKDREQWRRRTRKEIITQLTSIFEEYCKSEERKQIIDFIGELNQINLPDSQPPAAATSRAYVPPGARSDFRNRNRSYHKRRDFQSEADSNDNWRK